MPDYQWNDCQPHHHLLTDLSRYYRHDSLLADYLLSAGKTWIDNGADDFGLDVVKFVFLECVTP
jgi:hypothetical protein